MHSAFKCIENYYLLCEAAGDKAVQSYASTAKSLYEVFRNHTNDTYNAHCGKTLILMLYNTNRKTSRKTYAEYSYYKMKIAI